MYYGILFHETQELFDLEWLRQSQKSQYLRPRDNAPEGADGNTMSFYGGRGERILTALLTERLPCSVELLAGKGEPDNLIGGRIETETRTNRCMRFNGGPKLWWRTWEFDPQKGWIQRPAERLHLFVHPAEPYTDDRPIWWMFAGGAYYSEETTHFDGFGKIGRPELQVMLPGSKGWLSAPEAIQHILERCE